MTPVKIAKKVLDKPIEITYSFYMKISSNVPPPLPPPQPTITIEMTLQEAHIFHSAISVADYSKAQNHYINHRSDFNIHNLQHREKFNKIMYAIANQVGEQLEKF